MPDDPTPPTDGKGPARGYSWEPFKPGHTLSMRHGAHSPRVVQPIADTIEAQATTSAPWLAGPAFAPTVAAWSYCEAQATVLRRYLDEHGLLDAEGQPRGAGPWLDRIETRAAKLRAELGLSPLALARLLAALSTIDATRAPEGLEALRQAGAQVRQAAEERAIAATPTPAAIDQEDTP